MDDGNGNFNWDSRDKTWRFVPNGGDSRTSVKWFDNNGAEITSAANSTSYTRDWAGSLGQNLG